MTRVLRDTLSLGHTVLSPRKQIRIKHPVRLALAIIALSLTVPVTIDLVLYRHLLKTASKVRVGMTRPEVAQIVGNPNERYSRSIFTGFQSQWAYRTVLNWGDLFSPDFPYFKPIRPVISFSPTAGDVAVTFGWNGKVKSVRLAGRAR